MSTIFKLVAWDTWEMETTCIEQKPKKLCV